MQNCLHIWGLSALVLLGLNFGPLYGQSDPFAPKKKTQAAPSNFSPGYQVQQIRGAEVSRHIQIQKYQPISIDNTTFHAESEGIIDLKREGGEGLPISIRSQYPSLSSLGATTDAQIQEAALDYLSSIKADLHISTPQSEFDFVELRQAHGHTHIKFQQIYQGIPVYASEVMVHFGPSEEVRFGGRYHRTPTITDLSPDFSIEQARTKALDGVAAHAIVHEMSQQWKDFYEYEQPEATLVLYRPNNGSVGPLKLTWYIVVRPNLLQRYEYFIDAETGAILNHHGSHCSFMPDTGTGTDLNGISRTLNIFDFSGTFALWDVSKDMYNDDNGNGTPDDGEGYILTLDMNGDQPSQNANITYITSTNKNSWNSVGVSGHFNAGECYDYFKATHQRTSINGQGGDIISIVNVADPNASSAQPMDNAFWSGGLMYYGEGDQVFTNLAGALDVAAHEMSHGVIESTSNLEYQGQSGALNESFADIFGVMVDRDDWQLGEDIVKAGAFPAGAALRDVSDPHQGGNGLSSPGWQPNHMNEYWPDPNNQDNGGVHVNSGIVNYAFYLFATSAGMNKSKAEAVYYEALLNLTRSSQFVDCRVEVIAAANQLYGSSEATAAGNAFDQVGITDPGGGGGGGGGGTNYQVDVAPNPGTPFFVSNNTGIGSTTTHQVTSDFNNAPTQLSTTVPRTKLSVTDDGVFGFFVGEDNHIYQTRMDVNNIQEVQVSANPDWGNVAISKDGRLLAAVTQFVDTSIFVFDLEATPIAGWQFTLYNPTTAQGTNNTGGVLYADALSFDHCGEFLMYDAFNRLPNSSPGAPDIEFWDVNFMRVWDQSADQVGDGVVVKLFSNLPEGTSVGNAVFSKNSPYIIAFDEINSSAVNIKAANIETGDIGMIWDNSSDLLGYPEFENTDQFLTFNARDINGDDLIAAAALLPDKINLDMNYSTYNPFGLLADATWGVWFATGIRDLSTACNRPNVAIDPDVLEGEIQIFPNPFSDQFTVLAQFRQPTDVQIILFDLLGKQLMSSGELSDQLGAFEHHLSTQDLPAGAYLLSIEANGQQEMRKLLKQ